MKKLLDKWTRFETIHYVGLMKALLGLIIAVPTIGVYGVLQAFYITRNAGDLLTCLFIVITGVVISTLFAVTVYNEAHDERRASISRHPLTGKKVR